jgi:hypothetical protein
MTGLLAATVTAPQTTTTGLVKQFRVNPTHLSAQAQLVGGSGGTSIDAWLQTSLDGGTGWIDVAQFHVTNTPVVLVVNLSASTPVSSFTPTDGTLGANTVKDGIIGSKLRAKWSSQGTYTSSSGATVFTLVVEADQPLTASTGE